MSNQQRSFVRAAKRPSKLALYLSPREQAELRDLNQRINALSRVMAPLISRRNHLVQLGSIKSQQPQPRLF